jgi:Tol biopolymer transport system component
MFSIKYLKYVFLFIFWICVFAVEAQIIMEDGYIAIADSKEASGAIVNPKICPADSNLISYEVHGPGEIQLIIYNIQTKNKDTIDPALASNMADENTIASAAVNSDLAWCPIRPSNGNIWAAFISKATGSGELYLYEVNSKRYYQMIRTSDTLSSISRSANEPSWSSDGSCLTYTLSSGGNPDIYFMCNMENVMKELQKKEIAGTHRPLIYGEGEQFGAVWSPIPQTGILAYTCQNPNTYKYEIKVLDIIKNRTYNFLEIDSTLDYFAPSWSPDGHRLAYYLFEGRRTKEDKLTAGDKFGLGLAIITQYSEGDSIVITPQKGGTKGRPKIIDVAPNMDAFIKPAWSPDGKELIVPTYNEQNHNPMKTISIRSWEDGNRQSEWLFSIDGAEFAEFPRDINTIGRNIAFSYASGGNQKRYLLYGHLKSEIGWDSLTPLAFNNERTQEWDDIRKDKTCGWFCDIKRFLWKPVVGRDIGINKGIAVFAGLGFAIYAIVNTPPEPPGPPKPTDWGTPGFPNKINAANFHIKVGVGL